ncbi:MAG: phage tail tape measure protein [Deltaproteobacteria bacterium]|nr:phage tail tape measure protein [Deltaproteobacteria bacterium]
MSLPFRQAGKAATDLRRMLDAVGGDFNRSGQQARAAGADIEGFGDKAQVLARSIGQLGTAIGAGALFYGVTKGAKATLDAFSDFELKMQETASVAGATTRELDTMKKTALDLAGATGYMGSEIAGTFYEFASAGLSAAEGMAAVEPVLALAAAGHISLSDSVNVSTVAMKAFGLQATDVGHVTDVLMNSVAMSSMKANEFVRAFAQGGAVAKLAGQDLESFVAAVQNMKNVGINASDAGTSIKATLTQMIIKPAAEAEEAINRLGIKFREGADNSGPIKQWGDIIAELETKLAKLGEAERLNTLATLAGADGIRALAASLGIGSDKIKEQVEILKTHDGIVRRLADDALATFDGAMKQLKGTLGSLSVEMGSTFAPAVQNAAGWIKDLLQWIRELGTTTKTLLAILVGGTGLTAGLIVASAAIGALVAGIGVFGVGLGAVIGPIVAVGAALTALVAGVYAVHKAITADDNAVNKWGASFGVAADDIGDATVKLAAKAAKLEEEAYGAIERMNQLGTDTKSLDSLKDRFVSLAQAQERSVQQETELNDIVSKLNRAIPGLNLAYTNEETAIDNVTAAVKRAKEEKRKAIEEEARLYVLKRETMIASLNDAMAAEEKSQSQMRARIASLKADIAGFEDTYESTLLGYSPIGKMNELEELEGQLSASAQAVDNMRAKSEGAQAALNRIREAAQGKGLVEVLLGASKETADPTKAVEQAGQASAAALKKITDDAVSYMEKHLRNEIELAPSSEARAAAEKALGEFLESSHAAATVAGKNAGAAWVGYLEKVKADLLKVVNGDAAFFDNEDARVKAKKLGEEYKAQWALANAGMADMSKAFNAQVAAENKRLIAEGMLDPTEYAKGLDAILKAEQKSGRGQREVIDTVREARNEAIEAAMDRNRELAQSHNLSADEYARRQRELVNLSGPTSDARILAEAKLVAEVTQLREKEFADWYDLEQRKIALGGGSWSALASGLKGQLELIRGNSAEEIALRNKIVDAQAKAEERARTEARRTFELERRFGKQSLQNYLELIQTQKASPNLRAEELERLVSLEADVQGRIRAERESTFQTDLARGRVSLAEYRAYLSEKLDADVWYREGEKEATQRALEATDEAIRASQARRVQNRANNSLKDLEAWKARLDEEIQLAGKNEDKVEALMQQRLGVERQIRAAKLATFDYESRVDANALIRKREYLNKEIALLEEGTFEKRRLQEELRDVIAEIDYNRPIEEQTRAVGLLQAKVQLLGDTWEGFNKQESAGDKKSRLMGLIDTYRQLIDQQVAQYDLETKRASDTTLTDKQRGEARQNALKYIQDIYKTETELQARFKDTDWVFRREVGYVLKDANEQVNSRLNAALGATQDPLEYAHKVLDQMQGTTKGAESAAVTAANDLKEKAAATDAVAGKVTESAKALGTSQGALADVVTGLSGSAGQLAASGTTMQEGSVKIADSITTLGTATQGLAGAATDLKLIEFKLAEAINTLDANEKARHDQALDRMERLAQAVTDTVKVNERSAKALETVAGSLTQNFQIHVAKLQADVNQWADFIASEVRRLVP